MQSNGNLTLQLLNLVILNLLREPFLQSSKSILTIKNLLNCQILKMHSKRIFLKYVLLTVMLGVLSQGLDLPFSNDQVGYRIGKVESYTKLKECGKSALYSINAPQLDDGRPMKLIDLHGSHYEVGYDYGFMMADQIEYSYHALFDSELNNNTLFIQAMEMFLDWQYHSFVKRHTPIQFLQEVRGIKDGAHKSKKIGYVSKYIERVLVISNFPGDLKNDIIAVLFDEFLKEAGIGSKNDKVENFVQENILYVIRSLQKFIKSKQIMCSFFGVWGSRTVDGDLYTMRNLDWAQDTGINLNKLVFVYHIDNTYAHAVLGFPGLIGALTGISEKGITVHEAGQSSDLQSMEGFQWTLRMRHIMMTSSNLQEAMTVWNSTKNTLGMNFMIGSVSDRRAVALETMRGYTAVFKDNDPRENQTVFTDPKGNMFVAGHSMPEAVFRTNHAYDPIIRKHSQTKTYSNTSDTMIRYLILKDEFASYKNSSVQIGPEEAVRVTAILGDKGSEKFHSCKNNSHGLNVISVTYQPSQLKMWAAFEYGAKKTFKSACCGVYVEISLKDWFSGKTNQHQISRSENNLKTAEMLLE